MRISDDERDAFDRGEFLRSALGIATGDQNARLGMVAMKAPDGLADFIVGGRGYCAGIENDQAGVRCGSGGREAFGDEAGFNGGAVGLGGAAAEVFDEESIHYIDGSWTEADEGVGRRPGGSAPQGLPDCGYG